MLPSYDHPCERGAVLEERAEGELLAPVARNQLLDHRLSARHEFHRPDERRA
jgi:hypothetical protein